MNPNLLELGSFHLIASSGREQLVLSGGRSRLAAQSSLFVTEISGRSNGANLVSLTCFDMTDTRHLEVDSEEFEDLVLKKRGGVNSAGASGAGL